MCVQQVDSGVQQAANAINLPNLSNTKRTATKPAVTHVSPSIPAASSAPSSASHYNNNIVKPLPYVASNIDDFINNNAQLLSPREREISSSSAENDDNYDFEPYTRRDFRLDVKPTDKDNSSGYFTSPNELDNQPSRPTDVLSPESSEYEFQKSVVKHREEYSSSPADSQSGRSTSGRKSVSFDLDVEVEEYKRVYSPEENPRTPDDDDIFYEKSHYHHHQLQPQPKRIKGILRSPSPNVYYKGNVSGNVKVEKEFIDDDEDEDDDDEEEVLEKENPFRKEYLEANEPAPPSVTSESQRSGETLPSRIPIKKPIFKASGSLIDRPKIAPPRPPQPNIKVAAVVKNEGLQRMSQNMEEIDFIEFVHNAETNTVEPVQLFDPDDPLPPLPKCPPPPLNLQRVSSVERPKNSPPPPPTPKSEILEILPAKFDTFPVKQKPHFVNENSQNNILVSEDEHRDILLTENELRNALLTEYDDRHSAKANAEMLIPVFSPTNPFLDETSSFDSCSFSSTPNVLSPTSTLDKSAGSSFGQYVPQQPPPMNILPPPTQVLPVHYGQLPKPQHAGYYPLISHQHPVHYNAPSTGLVLSTPQNQSDFEQLQQHQHFLHQQSQTQPRAYLVSGDGQNNFYVTHNVNNTANNQQQHQTLLMQSAYGPPPPPPASLQLHMQPAHSQYVANHNRPQFIYEQHQQPPRAYYPSNAPHNHNQYQQHYTEPASELSPIRVNQVPQNFIYPTSAPGEAKPSMSSFGKQTEV